MENVAVVAAATACRFRPFKRPHPHAGDPIIVKKPAPGPLVPLPMPVIVV